MNPIEKGLRRVDGFQQEHTPLAFLFAVMKKYGDDNGGVLVGSLANTAFGAIFPLLLLIVTVLSMVVATRSSLYNQVLHSSLTEFPVIGSKLGSSIKAIHRNSVIGLTVGLLGLVWSSLGLAQNGIFTMEQVWNLPGPDRPNYIKRLGRSVSFLAVLALGLSLSTFLAAASPTANGSFVLTVLGALASAVVNFGEYLFAFRVLTPTKVKLRQLVPGCAVAGIVWTAMQALGGYIVGHYLKDDSAVYGTFAIVLGLFAWVYLATEVTVYCAEINVVLARRLWPRSVVQPPLTDADRRSMSAQAIQNRRRPEQRVDVSFEDAGSTYGDADQPPDKVAQSDVDVTATQSNRRAAARDERVSDDRPSSGAASLVHRAYSSGASTPKA